MTYWHYTCDHGRKDIGDQGELKSLALLRPKALLSAGEDWVLRRQLVWVTDLAEPDIEGLGLTNETLTCERWRYRYRVLNERPVQRFSDIQHRFSPYVQASLLAGNAKPEHWFVSWVPLPVVYDPPALIPSWVFTVPTEDPAEPRYMETLDADERGGR